MNNNDGLNRILGLKEAISMTVGTVVGVGLFTCGSAQVGKLGPYIIVFTFLALLISIWPCLLYGEMSAMLPGAGGTYNYAKRGLSRLWATIAGWNYIISVVAIGAGETLAFSNYFKILFEQIGIDLSGIDSRIIAIILVSIFIFINLRGIEISGKAQTGFIFFFWGCSIMWFLYMIPKIHLEYFGDFAMSSLPPFKELMYIFGLIWWCYTGFETCVSMGGEIKYPQYNLPRALKLSVFLVFAVNALFQWFLVGLVPSEFYGAIVSANAPYAEGLRAVGLVGFPIILLCIGIAFGGDLSTINPGIAAPSRYIYSMAQDNTLPKLFCKISQKYKTPYTAIIMVGIINIILIVTDSINFIASVSLFSLAICYIIGCMSYIGLRKKCKNLNRPYKAPQGNVGAIVTIILYLILLIFVEKNAMITGLIVSILSVLYYLVFVKKGCNALIPVEEEIGVIEEPTNQEKEKLDKEYQIWKIGTIIATVLGIAIYLVPILLG